VSTATARVLPAHSPRPVGGRGPRLHAVATPARRRRPRLLYAIVAIAGAVAIGAAQMGLSIVMTQGGYEERALRQEQRALQWEHQSLGEELAGLSSPQYLAANAAALGMVINEAPSYLRLSDGAVMGTGTAASWQSAVDAIGRGSVANALVADVPLVTEPDATISGLPQIADPVTGAELGPDGQVGVDPALPPALSEGLPTPVTH